MALDFTTGTLDPRVTVTRALNTATAINSSGFIAVVNANLPRFDYNPNTLAPRGLLIEETRTNLFIQSQFQGNWTANAGTTTFLGTYVTSPDGTSNGRILNDTSAAAAAYVFQGVSFTSGTVYTLSVYVKKGVSRYLALTSFTQSGRALFDLNNYSLSSVTGIVTSATITSVGGGWYRCTATMTASATGSNNLGFGDFEAGPTGDLYYIWGAQVEAGAFATSYIPTTTVSLTRNADDVTMTGTNFTSWYSASEGTFTSTFSAAASTASVLVTDAAGSGRPLYIVSGGVVRIFDGTAPINAGGTYTFGTVASAGSSYGGGTMSCALNGGTVGTGAFDGSMGTSGLYIGRNPAQPNEYIKGHIQKVAFYPMRFSDRQLQAFSK
jgi:hypothetical protein